MIKKSALERNIVLYKIFRVLTNGGFIGPVWVLFCLHELKLSWTQIFVVEGIAFAVWALWEIPSGYLADTIGRKRCLMWGSSLMAISMSLCVMTESIWLWLAGDVLWMIGASLVSGSDAALLKESLIALGRSEDYEKHVSQARGFMLLCAAPPCILAGFMGTFSLRLPFLAQALIEIGALVCAMLMTETLPTSEAHLSFGKHLGEIKSVLYLALKNKAIFCASMFSAFALINMGCIFYTPYFISCQLPIWLYGFAFAVFNVFSSLVAFQSEKIRQRLGTKGALSLILGGRLLSWLLMSLWHPFWGAAFILGEQFSRGIKEQVIEGYVLRHAPTEKRATIISTVRQIEMLPKMIALVFAGSLLDALPLPFTLWVLSIFSLVGGGYFLMKLPGNGLEK